MGPIEILLAFTTILLSAIGYLLQSERIERKEGRAEDKATDLKFKEMILLEVKGVKDTNSELSNSIKELSSTIKSTGEKQDERIASIHKRLDLHDEEIIRNRVRFDKIFSKVTSVALQAEIKGWFKPGEGDKDDTEG